MDKTSDFLADEDLPKARVARLLKHFSRLDDDREPWRVVYPLSEVLLLPTCATSPLATISTKSPPGANTISTS